MRGFRDRNLPRDAYYRLYVRQNGVAMSVELRDVDPGGLEAAVSMWLRRSGCNTNNTRILRVELPHVNVYGPSPRLALDHVLNGIGPQIGGALDGNTVSEVLAAGWAVAAREYQARVYERNGRRYTLHDFAGPLRVQAGPITADLTCLHPALTTDADDLFPVIGEARLDIGIWSLVVEFDGEIDETVATQWRCLSVDAARHLARDEFPADGWFVVESVLE